MSFLTYDEVAKSAVERLHNPPEGIQLPWWDKFNELVGGLLMHELTIVTAPTGAGKTTFLANLVCQAVQRQLSSYVISAEVGNESFMLQMWSAMEQKHLNTGERFSREFAESVRKKWDPIFKQSRILFSQHDDFTEPGVIADEIEEAHRRFNCKLAILDNLNFLTRQGGSSSEMAEQDENVRRWIRLAKRLPVHLFVIAHPKKTQSGRVENEYDIKGSSTLVQEASNVISVNRLSDETLKDNDEHDPTDRQMKFHKLRLRGWNTGKSIVFSYHEGRYKERVLGQRSAESTPQTRSSWRDRAFQST